MSPTARTLQRLKAEGIPAQTVERFCHFSKRRIDLFNPASPSAARRQENERDGEV